jgi:hypothetical protein
MTELFHALLAFPTIAFTACLGLALLYWVMVIVGAADLNPFDGAEGAAKGAVEGAVKGVAESAGDVVGDHVNANALTEALAWLGLSKVPITISFSLFSLFGWVTSFAARHFLDPLLPNFLSAIVATGVSLVSAVFLASLAVRPLGGIFKDETERKGGVAHRGKTVRITSHHVDEKVGQAELDDGGGGLTLNVRSPPGNTLKRGDEAVIMDVDEKEGIYYVEPLRAVLPSTQDAFEAAKLDVEAAQQHEKPR